LIALHSVSKELGRGSHRRLVLNNISWQIPPRSRIVVLGQRGAGKSSLLEIISGARYPTSGWVERRGSICSVERMALQGRGTSSATLRQLAIGLARLYHLKSDDFVRFVGSFADMEKMIDVPVRMLPKSARQRLKYALAYGIPFDFYLFDGSINGRVGKRGQFGRRCAAAFEMRCQRAGVILMTSSPKIAEEFDGTAAVLHRGSIFTFPTAGEALAFFKGLPPPADVTDLHSEDEGFDDVEEESWL